MSSQTSAGLRLSVTVPGRPGAKPRARTSFFDKHGKVRAKPVTFTPKAGVRWETEVKEHVQLAMVNAGWPELLEQPMAVNWIAVYQRPKTKPEKIPKDEWASGRRLYFPSRPDRDNIDKSVLDACTEAGLWADDEWVVDGRTIKAYASVRENPHIEIRVRTLGFFVEWKG